MLDWTKPICTKRLHIGAKLPDCAVTGRKRVAIASPSSLSGPSTVFLYDTDGRTRGDGEPSDNDLMNFDHDDGARRIPAPKEA